jgi:hypothetical protein
VVSWDSKIQWIIKVAYDIRAKLIINLIEYKGARPYLVGGGG